MRDSATTTQESSQGKGETAGYVPLNASSRPTSRGPAKTRRNPSFYAFLTSKTVLRDENRGAVQAHLREHCRDFGCGLQNDTPAIYSLQIPKGGSDTTAPTAFLRAVALTVAVFLFPRGNSLHYRLICWRPARQPRARYGDERLGWRCLSRWFLPEVPFSYLPHCTKVRL